MRNSAYSFIVRESILQLVKRSTDAADSTPQMDSSRISFYRQFMNRNSMRSCRILSVQTVANLPFQRNYALYNIQILTEDTKYEIKKRYSEFEILYYTTLKEQTKDVEFPRKTIFQSGCAEEVTAKRAEQLNKLMEEINKQSSCEQIKMKFYEFIQLYEKYQQEGILTKDKRMEVTATDQYLMLSICKLNQHSSNSLEVFQLIKLSLAERKRRVGYQTARQLLVGFEDYDGLIPLIVNNDNHLILIQGLKLLNIILEPQTNRDYQIFNRVIQKYPASNLIVNSSALVQNCQLKVAYFTLLKHYLDVRHEISIKQIAKFYEGIELEVQYIRWLQYFNISSRH